MKLSHIPGTEPSVKVNFALKQSTANRLDAYKRLHEAEHGTKVTLKDLVERMLNQFMDEDRDFQRQCKVVGVAPAIPAPAVYEAMAAEVSAV